MGNARPLLASFPLANAAGRGDDRPGDASIEGTP
jgi:hypothetical protein